jgi:hypothetical protein
MRRAATGVALSAMVALAACGGSDDASPVTPNLPDDPSTDPTFRNAAFVFDVNLRKGTVNVKAPEVKLNPSIAKLGNGVIGRQTPEQPLASILSNDVISITTSNFFASTVGAINPNEVRVLFDVQVQNILPGIELITPTFPQAPAGQAGLILFPFSVNVTTTTGGVGTENGNEVIVELPSRGEVRPNVYWNGSATPDRPTFPTLPAAGGDPFSFFNDAACTGTPAPNSESDCYRYETFGPIGPGAISAARTVGFDITATVGEFRARLIAAADLRASGAAATGALDVNVTSPERGALQGVTVSVTGVATPVLTNAAGLAQFPTLGLGARTVALSTLPAGCTTPASQPATILGGQTATVNFSVTCTALAGTVSGTITRAGAGTQNLAGVTVTIDPAAAGLANVTATSTGGPATAAYTANVPLGTGAGAGAGAVTLSNLPSGCAAPAAGAYTGLTSGGTQTVSFTVTCDAPAARDEFTSTWGAIAAGQVDLTITFNPAGFDNPEFPGVDQVGAVQAITTLTGSGVARLTAVTAFAPAGTIFATPTINFVAPSVAWVTNTTAPGGLQALGPVAGLRFTVGAGAAGTVTTSTNVQEIATPLGDAYTYTFSGAGQNINVNEATLTIP